MTLDELLRAVAQGSLTSEVFVVLPDGTLQCVESVQATHAHSTVLRFQPLPASPAPAPSTRPVVEWDDAQEVVKIGGVPYSYEVFRQLGYDGFVPGAVFRVERRLPDGALVLRRPGRADLHRWADELTLWAPSH